MRLLARHRVTPVQNAGAGVDGDSCIFEGDDPDEEFCFVSFTAPSETSNPGCDVGDAHGEETIIVGGGSVNNARC